LFLQAAAFCWRWQQCVRFDTVTSQVITSQAFAAGRGDASCITALAFIGATRRRRCLSRQSRQCAGKRVSWVPFDTVLQRSHVCARGFATSAVVPVAIGTGTPAALSLPL
jgi:hypothetical protein